MNIYSQVWPYLMNILYTMIFNDFCQYYLYPGRNTANSTHIPLWRLAYDQFDTLFPIWFPGNVTSGLIEATEPTGNVFGLYATHVSLVVIALLIQSSGTTQHEDPF